jgi:hypothetical protein
MPEAPVRARQMVLFIEGFPRRGFFQQFSRDQAVDGAENQRGAAKIGVSRKTPSCGISHRRASSNWPPMWAKAARMLRLTGPNQRAGRWRARPSVSRLKRGAGQRQEEAGARK